MDDEILDRCRERVTMGVPLSQPDAVALVKAVVEARGLANEIYAANEYQGISFETYRRRQRGELSWLKGAGQPGEVKDDPGLPRL